MTHSKDHKSQRIVALPFEVEAVLFDLDDTLYNRDRAYSNWASSFARAYFPQMDSHALQAIIAALIEWDDHGYAARNYIFEQLLQRYPSLNATLDDLLAVYHQGFIKAIEPEATTIQVLQALTKACIPFGIITNGSARQQQKIEVLGLVGQTSCIYISHLFGAHKPDTTIFLAAAAELQVPPEKILFVGDHPHNDIWGAHQAGMHTAWLQRSYAWPETLPEQIRDLTLQSLLELLIAE